jgi:hypothetical protein
MLGKKFKNIFLNIEKTTYFWGMKNSKPTLLNMIKSRHREESKSMGYYDGRFRSRVVESKKYKPVKHKKFEYED